MPLVPEYLYPSYEGTFNGMTCGMSMGSGWSINYYFGKVIEIDLTGFNLSSEWFEFPMMEFPNGYKLIGRIRYNSENRTFFMSGLWKYNDAIVSTPDGVNMIQVNDTYSEPYRSGVDYSHLYMTLDFVYPGNAVENLTKCNYLAFTFFFDAFRNITLPSGMVELRTGLDTKITDFNVITGNQIRNILYGDNTYIVNPMKLSVCNLSNLDLFNTFMRTAGDGQSEDPFKPTVSPEDDPSGPGGGGGNYDPKSDPVDIPQLPTGGALTSGMLKGFVISAVQLQQLQSKLWDMSIFDIATQFQKLVNQPLDCLISLHCLPVLPATGQSEEVKLGSFPTGVNALRITNQYLEVDAGSITISEYWGSALDYAPFTKCEIYVPFVGFRNLVIEDIQKTTLHLVYHVDVLTGDCVAYLKCGQSVLYTWTGNCLNHIPCTSQTNDLLAKNIGAIGALGVGIVTGNPASTAAGAISGAVNSATAKNHVQRSGDVAGSPGIMSEFTPYLVFHRPKQSLAKGYNNFKGYPSNITYVLSQLSGYTEVEHVHLTGINNATDTELQEIENLLKSGVII